MIVCFHCKSETKAKMDGLISQGHYRDYAELFAGAIDNLWMLEQEIAEKGALVFGENPAASSAPAASPTPIERSKALNTGKTARPSKLSKTPKKGAPNSPWQKSEHVARNSKNPGVFGGQKSPKRVLPWAVSGPRFTF